jgi:ankyrin repeat protein
MVPDHVDDMGEGLLHYACLGGHVDCAEYLVQNHCYLDLQSASGATPLHMATINKHKKIISYLIKNVSQTLSSIFDCLLS